MSKCCAKYTARDLREAVLFEVKTRVSDGAGGSTEDWAALTDGPTMAMARPMSGGERWASHRVEATSSHRIVVRYDSRINEKMRVTLDGRLCNIRFVANVDFADEWLEIDVQMGVAV